MSELISIESQECRGASMVRLIEVGGDRLCQCAAVAT